MKTKNNSAIALILSVGILAILTLITVGFSAFTRLELQATENQINLLKASYIAQAGIAQAISDIKYDPNFGAINEPYDSCADPWYYPGDANYHGSIVDLATATHPSYGGDIDYADGSYRLKVIDCGGLININCPLPDADARTDLTNMLLQLGLPNAAGLITLRQTLPGQVFTTKEEIKLVNGITQTDYEAIRDFITLWGDADDGHSMKSFINVNTAPLEVLQAVFRLMMGSPGNDSQADALAAAVKARRSINPFDGIGEEASVVDNFLSARGEFQRFVEYAYSSGIITLATNRDAVIAQSDPNKYSSANPNSTNSAIIGFDANGYYEIEAIGTCRGARKRINQVVSVFRKINQTTKDEFRTKAELLATQRVSWKDTCPVDFTLLKQFNYPDDKIGDATNPDDYIENSLKLGFWDNFQEDYVLSSLGPWQEVYETFTINQGNDGLLRTVVAGALVPVPGQDYFPRVTLDQDVCIVDDFAMIARGADETSLSKYAVRDNLPWPAIPLEWWFFAPAPDALNCPDIGKTRKDSDGNDIIIDQQYILDNLKSWGIHEQYLNTLHVRFGGMHADGLERMSAIFCNAPQTTAIWTPPLPSPPELPEIAYKQWINYDGSGYIYLTPSPNYVFPDWQAIYQTCRKPYSVISGSNVMVACNEWHYEGGTEALSVFSDDGVEDFLITGNAYQADKTFHLKAIGRWHTRGDVYFNSTATRSFDTTQQVMVWQDRYFQFAGMGNFPDVDYFRVVPSQGVYTSTIFSGLAPALEWGTIRAHVTLPVTADPAIADATAGSEPVYLVVFNSAVVLAPAPSYVPASFIMPSGGAIGPTISQSIGYQVYLFSDFGKLHGADPDKPDNPDDADFEQAPVVEDVTITYLPITQIIYYNAM
ncbi:MAG: general secretion pathway protein GspK [Candidatus Omnitrophica bacterium]|nr:general secretion pathway protein GspK [Candidatus Omnitrophota bacterium]